MNTIATKAIKVNTAMTRAAIARAMPKVALLLLSEEEEPDENVCATLASEYGNGMLLFTTKFAITWKLGEPKPNTGNLDTFIYIRL